MITLERMFEVHAAYSLDKQMALAELLNGSGAWRFDMDSGTLAFGTRHTFAVQVLGTESHSDKSWLWGWANLQSGIPKRLLQAAEQLRAFGVEHGVPELTEAESPLARLNGDYFAMIASGACKADGFYRGPYAGGALYLLLTLPEHLKKRANQHSG